MKWAALILTSVLIGMSKADFEFMGEKQVDALVKNAEANMNRLSNFLEDAVGAVEQADDSAPMPRREIHMEMHPAKGAEIDIEMEFSAPKKGFLKSMFAKMGSSVQHGVKSAKKKIQKGLSKGKLKGKLGKFKGKLQGIYEDMSRRAAPMAQLIMQKAKKMQKRMMREIRHMEDDGMSQWMDKLRAAPKKLAAKKMRMMWYKKALLARCPEVEKLCPDMKCPHKLTKCLQHKTNQVSQTCGLFLNHVSTFEAKKKQAKNEFKHQMAKCESLDEEQLYNACRDSAKATKRTRKQQLRAELKANIEEEANTKVIKVDVDEAAKKAVSFVESKLHDLQSALEPTEGCKTDDDCHAGGDMGGYCKSNGDCHCTAPFFASDGKGSCTLSCTPTSKPTACCRDDADCQAGGDSGAYCKSPKSSAHTTPGNGMCRCGTGFKGTTSCTKAAEANAEETIMNEAAPAWTTGDAEAPAGEKDMGGWTMRVYTPEQQSRLHVDEEGTPEGSLVESQEAPGSVAPERSEKAIGDAAKAIADDEASQRRLFMFLGLLVAVAIAVLALGVGAARHRARRQALELGAVYGQAMGKASVVPAAQTSEDQL